ncbi:hypothetical protein GGX14DRAFT_655518 [Mycena pura]|uniref:Uncharacterized protein n=1 Tax=Mycena pura TaxID=153505 RepID=A0AAD6V789_9AGAR|nr:hypothetical protein GGX14DRAFT_655518 [Mycena pura]
MCGTVRMSACTRDSGTCFRPAYRDSSRPHIGRIRGNVGERVDIQHDRSCAPLRSAPRRRHKSRQEHRPQPLSALHPIPPPHRNDDAYEGWDPVTIDSCVDTESEYTETELRKRHLGTSGHDSDLDPDQRGRRVGDPPQPECGVRVQLGYGSLVVSNPRSVQNKDQGVMSMAGLDGVAVTAAGARQGGETRVSSRLVFIGSAATSTQSMRTGTTSPLLVEVQAAFELRGKSNLPSDAAPVYQDQTAAAAAQAILGIVDIPFSMAVASPFTTGAFMLEFSSSLSATLSLLLTLPGWGQTTDGSRSVSASGV